MAMPLASYSHSETMSSVRPSLALRQLCIYKIIIFVANWWWLGGMGRLIGIVASLASEIAQHSAPSLLCFLPFIYYYYYHLYHYITREPESKRIIVFSSKWNYNDSMLACVVLQPNRIETGKIRYFFHSIIPSPFVTWAHGPRLARRIRIFSLSIDSLISHQIWGRIRKISEAEARKWICRVSMASIGSLWTQQLRR